MFRLIHQNTVVRIVVMFNMITAYQTNTLFSVEYEYKYNSKWKYLQIQYRRSLSVNTFQNKFISFTTTVFDEHKTDINKKYIQIQKPRSLPTASPPTQAYSQPPPPSPL